MGLAKEMPRTEDDCPRVRRKAASTGQVAGCTENIRWGNFTARKFEMLEHEYHRRT
jgi:hypothetical protein